MTATFTTKDGELYIDGKKVLKGWESFSGWYWFATEIVEEIKEPADSDSSMTTDVLYFGFVQGFEEEWGNFSLAEMQPLIDQGKIWEIKPQDLPFAGRRSSDKQ